MCGSGSTCGKTDSGLEIAPFSPGNTGADSTGARDECFLGEDEGGAASCSFVFFSRLLNRLFPLDRAEPMVHEVEYG